MVTEALNRRLNILQSSGTCPSDLLDVIRLLVAHANETDLFKKELRSQPFTSPVQEPQTQQQVQQRAQQEMPVVQYPEDMQQCAFRARENILMAAESSLRSYVANLKNVNDIATAASSKKLREIKKCISEEMKAFQERVIQGTVEEMEIELDSLRMKWLETIDKEVSRVKEEIHQMGIGLRKELRNMAEGYGDFMAKGFKLINLGQFEEIHKLRADSVLAAGRLELVEKQIVPQMEIEALRERIKMIEMRMEKILGCSLKS
uniref:Uncharacterized protein n=1 Tax=Trypanosoma congolense (strain IL3000) TaxID=1068625 RepID=G0UW72_TRYCI|nr:conserved hypothetical protein [Trypanosoma congolense IL3000]